MRTDFHVACPRGGCGGEVGFTIGQDSDGDGMFTRTWNYAERVSDCSEGHELTDTEQGQCQAAADVIADDPNEVASIFEPSDDYDPIPY